MAGSTYITDHFRHKYFQAIACTSTDNKRKTAKIKQTKNSKKRKSQ